MHFPGVPAAAWLALLLLTASVRATYWTVTSYFVLSLSTTHFGTYTETDFYHTYTETQTVQSDVTPTASPISTSSYVFEYRDLTIIYVYLPLGAVAEADIVTATPSFSRKTEYTIYVEPVVYTAPASCPTPFTVTTTTVVDIPTEVTHLYSPTATSTEDGYVTMFLPQDAVPLASLSTDYIYSHYIADCRNPTATDDAYWGPSATGSGNSDGSSSLDDTTVCSLLTGCTTLRTWVIVIAAVIPSLFLLGFVESFLWFRRLMLGKSCLRFGTVCWICISLWILCFTRNQAARSVEDQALLRQQWDGMGFWKKWKLWWRWGFRHAYPVDLLGDPGVPTRAGQTIPAMQQGQDEALPPYTGPAIQRQQFQQNTPMKTFN